MRVRWTMQRGGDMTKQGAMRSAASEQGDHCLRGGCRATSSPSAPAKQIEVRNSLYIKGLRISFYLKLADFNILYWKQILQKYTVFS